MSASDVNEHATILLDTGLDLGDVERLREAVEDLEPGEAFLLSHEFGAGIVNLIARSAAADRERETMSQLNQDLIRDCANLTTRVETAERRNKGILAELSASGGRNIDLRQRAEAAEAKVAAMPRTVGFVVVDIKTRKLDWDGELHPTIEAAVGSLTGSHQMWCRTPEEETDERTYFGEVYEILPVTQ